MLYTWWVHLGWVPVVGLCVLYVYNCRLLSSRQALSHSRRSGIYIYIYISVHLDVYSDVYVLQGHTALLHKTTAEHNTTMTRYAVPLTPRRAILALPPLLCRYSCVATADLQSFLRCHRCSVAILALPARCSVAILALPPLLCRYSCVATAALPLLLRCHHCSAAILALPPLLCRYSCVATAALPLFLRCQRCSAASLTLAST